MGKMIKKRMIKKDGKEISKKMGMRMKGNGENIIRKRLGKKIGDRKEVRKKNERRGRIWERICEKR